MDNAQKPGKALITESQPSAQRSTQNRNVGYTYVYSHNLNDIDDITINNYDNIQLHDIGNL